ncbi:2-isopropylmalate synthase [uncultured Enterobacter sp.]|uniref:2-isopropylmalate synthase n=1 Tax=uncultured Enterobacter sp. TaxID=238202 RepID=UPI0025934B86|nr:2-isopropylmalate synthase [uncultured Enterobacter sp.]
MSAHVTGGKYCPMPQPELPNRQWPTRALLHAPRWCSVDLRDGNQALPEPMNPQQKRALYQQLVAMGYKEIEVGFPAASETDYQFVRTLIDDGLIPDDVRIQVLTQARENLIADTVAALSGVKEAVVHLYNSTSLQQREQVFNLSRAGVIELALQGVRWLLEEMAKVEQNWVLEYSPESFTATEMDFALEICNAVIDLWVGKTGREVIINLPATVELASPNVYADQIEWISGKLRHRQKVTLCVHPHNDRGCAVAAAEMALLAGAERVEGTLFGNGERTGNVDLVTLGLNLLVQGVDPLIDFSQLPQVVNVYESATGMTVPPRHPYAGSLVFTAFSGSHQDAIRKSMELQKYRTRWDVPYLPLDPHDIGRSYEGIIRINGQSGKGGLGYLLDYYYGIRPPRPLLIRFQQHIQTLADASNQELEHTFLHQQFHAFFATSDSISEAHPGGMPAEFHPQWDSHRLGASQVMSYVWGTWQGELVYGIGLDISEEKSRHRAWWQLLRSLPVSVSSVPL